MNRAENPPENPRIRAPHSLGRATEALEIPAFRRIFVSNMAFFLAMGGQSIVRPWLAFELTDSPFALSLVSAATAVPMLLLRLAASSRPSAAFPGPRREVCARARSE